MLSLLKKLKRKISLFIKIYIKKEFSSIDIWFWIDGDKTLRLNYPLNEKSLVFDLGGYKGEWASNIFKQYGAEIWIFEPVQKFYMDIYYNFLNNDKIKVFNIGLSDHNDIVDIYLSNDGTSIYNKKNSNLTEKIVLKDINDFIIEHKLTRIDLMKINIEGSEYELLETLLKTGNIRKIVNIQIQFHYWIENATTRRENIRNELAKTHRETYCFPFVWENWELKS